MKADAARVPDLLLERYRLGEVTPEEKAAVERQMNEDATLRERLERLERSDEAIRGGGFTASLATRLQDARPIHASAAFRPEKRRSRVPLRWALPAAVGVGALVVLMATRPGLAPHVEGDRIKGLQPSLSVFRQTPRGSETLADGVTARAGDVVRVGYQAAGQSYGVIVSMDGRGGVTLHLPPAGREAAPLHRGNPVLLDQAYELDDAPAWESFYFVTAQAPFDAGAIVAEARREAALHPALPPASLALAGRFEQSRFVLRKEHKP